jgi:hypothetical protein
MYIKVFKLLFKNVLLAKATEYVQRTDNDLDDQFLKALVAFVNAL